MSEIKKVKAVWGPLETRFCRGYYIPIWAWLYPILPKHKKAAQDSLSPVAGLCRFCLWAAYWIAHTNRSNLLLLYEKGYQDGAKIVPFVRGT